jgi:hypothetical protein
MLLPSRGAETRSSLVGGATLIDVPRQTPDLTRRHRLAAAVQPTRLPPECCQLLLLQITPAREHPRVASPFMVLLLTTTPPASG